MQMQREFIVENTSKQIQIVKHNHYQKKKKRVEVWQFAKDLLWTIPNSTEIEKQHEIRRLVKVRN